MVALMILATVAPFLNHYRMQQKYIAKGIYEVGGTFVLSSPDGGNQYASVCYMVCKPPTDRNALKSMADKYIQDNNIIETLKERGKGKITLDLELEFVKPSKLFPIGWNSGDEQGNYLDKSYLEDNEIMTICIPVNATSEEEYTYIFNGAYKTSSNG